MEHFRHEIQNIGPVVLFRFSLILSEFSKRPLLGKIQVFWRSSMTKYLVLERTFGAFKLILSENFAFYVIIFTSVSGLV